MENAGSCEISWCRIHQRRERLTYLEQAEMWAGQAGHAKYEENQFNT